MSAPYIPDASGSSDRTTTRRASTPSTTPERFATTAAPESLATTDSIPVPTNGGSVRRSGTACRCMLDPMSARLASSCSRNGTREAPALASDHHVLDELALRVHRRVGLRDDVPLLLHRGEEDDLHRHGRTDHDPVRRLDEPELVDPREGGQRGDQPDVRSFRRLDRADAPVVRRVDVAHLEPRALPGQPAGPEGGG